MTHAVDGPTDADKAFGAQLAVAAAMLELADAIREYTGIFARVKLP